MKSYNIEVIFDGGSVVHGSEEHFFDLENHDLLEDLVTHHELFASSGDQSVVVKDSHTSVSGDVHLHGDVSG